MNAMSVSELCKLVARKKGVQLAMLKACALPGTIWGREDMRFAALIVGEVEPGKTRVSCFDADGFTGHTDVDDVPEHLIAVFGVGVKRMPAPDWLR